MASQTVYRVEKLEGTKNYGTWKYAMKMLLIKDKLWQAVEPLADKDIDPEVDQQALAAIVLNISPNIYVRTKTAKTAKEAWSKLEKAFESTGLRRQIVLDRQLYSTKLTDFNRMEDYINKMLEIQTELANVGREVSDEYMAFKLLANLTDDYDSLVIAMENSGKTLVLDTVIENLLQEEIRRNESMLKQDSAFGGKSNKHNFKKAFIRPRDSSGKRNPNCFICGKPGHIAKMCKSNKSTSRDQTSYQKSSTSNAYAAVDKNTPSKQIWYLDSGATRHMSSQKELFENIVSVDEKINIETVDGSVISSKGMGNIPLTVNIYGKSDEIVVKDTLYIPDLKMNLLSIGKIADKGNELLFNEKKCTIRKKNTKEIIGTGSRTEDGLYALDITKNKGYMTRTLSDYDLWHQRLGHISKNGLQRLQKGLVLGLPEQFQSHDICEDCIFGKQSRATFPDKKGKRATEILGLVHSDLCGPMEVESIGKAKYFLTFIDDKSRKTFVYFLRQKNEVFHYFQRFKVMVENETGRKIKKLRTDNGKEYLNKSMEDFLNKNGISHQRSAPYTPEQNGVAERANRTIVERVRCLLKRAELDKTFWAEAVNTIVYLKNRSPTIAVRHSTPEEAWSGEKPNVAHLRVFGCKAFVQIPDVKRRKLDVKSKECIFLGYEENSKAYRLFDNESKKILISRNVIFLENKISPQIDSNESDSEKVNEILIFNEKEVKVDNLNEELQNQNINERIEMNQEGVSCEKVEEEEQDKTKRNRKQPTYLQDYLCFANSTKKSNFSEPLTLTEALQSDSSEKWKEAIVQELESHEVNNTWDIVESVPEGRKAIKSKWVFKIKKGTNGQIEKYKARLVAKGYSQEEGIDYEETFSPVVRQSTLKALIALATELDLEMEMMDVVTAYLNSELSEEIYMELPKTDNPINSKIICKLNKAIYGLKQSGRAWNRKLHNELMKYNLNQSKVDPCLYFRITGEQIFIVTVYVDDILLFGSDRNEIQKFKKKLSEVFEMKDLGAPHQCLGIRIERDKTKHITTLDQEHYIESILEEFNMSNCHSVSTPMIKGHKLTKNMGPRNDEERREMRNIPYRKAIGKLVYLSQWTRPDISHAVSVLSKFNNDPGKEHWTAVKRVLRYLRGTSSKKLIFEASNQKSIIGYCDSDWGGDSDDRKSYAGYIFKFGKSLISWNSKKQPTVALSTTEAEYMALSHAVKEALWLQQLFQEMSINNIISKPVDIFCDNTGATELSKNNVFHARSKHIDIRHHFVRDAVENGNICVKSIGTDDMPADILTKVTSHSKFDWCIENFGLL